jgi:hypothetical protein
VRRAASAHALALPHGGRAFVHPARAYSQP